MAKTTQKEINDLRNQLEDITSQLEELGLGSTARIKNIVNDYLSAGGEKVSELRDVVTDKVNTAKTQTDEYAHENPWNLVWSSLAIGLVLGFLFGKNPSQYRK